jgi:hypothetical protein
MARKKTKARKYKRWLDLNAKKILCRYCDLKDNCKARERKESYEREGIMTYCTQTPNGKKKSLKDVKLNKKGEIINVNKNGIPIDVVSDDKKNKDKKVNKKYNSKYNKSKKKVK